jgi:hypothetical protein
MPGFLRKAQTIESLEEENENLDAQLSVAEKKALLRELEAKYGKGAWKLFARGKEQNNGSGGGSGGEKKGFRSGIAWDQVKFKLGK